jgi:hypothetical protein
MNESLTAVVLDDQTVMFDGLTLAGIDEVAEAIRLTLQSVPNFLLMIEGTPEKHYEGIGTVIYGSARAGFDLENLRYSWKGTEAS